MRSSTRFLAIGCLLLAQSVAFAQVQHRGFRMTNKRAKRVTIPFELHSNLVIIPVRVNDGETLKFILDTGVRTAILTDQGYVDGIPLVDDRVITVMGVGDQGEISAYVSSGVSFDLPEGVAAIGNSILILKDDYLQLDSFLGTRIHGILGYELFSRFVVEIDYMRQQVVLHRPDKFRPRKSFQKIPISVEDTKPYVEGAVLRLNDSTTLTTKLMIDTGASHSLMLNRQSDERITVPERHISGYLGRGLSGEIYGQMARVPQLNIGDYTLKKVTSSFPEENAFLEAVTERTGNQGNIGGAILKRFRVIFDYANGMVYLKKNRLFRTPFEYNMSGIELKATGPLLTTLLVSTVVKDSPARRAGIQPGDMIVSINGQYPPVLTLAMFNQMMSVKPGKKIRLKIYRGGMIFKKSFRLERIL
ncbi:MAG: aspartyl protease family protein [Tunicatimonas sp.]